MKRLAICGLLALTAGCLARNAPEPRFFRPDSTLLREPLPATDAPRVSRSVAAVRLRAVEGGPFLRERMVWRTSAVEYGEYEQRRWREVPAAYVERALRAALRRSQAVRLSDDPRVPSLHVDVLAFDEVLAPTHGAAVETWVSLRDKSGQLLLDAPFTAQKPIVGDDPATLAQAMGGALDEVASRIAEAVTQAVTKRK